MNIEKAIEAFKGNGYTVSHFMNHEEAAVYIDSQIDGKVVGFGDSRTLIKMDMYNRLASHNTVYDPNQSVDNDEFVAIAKKTLVTDVFLTSVNAMSETGEMVNIDGTGNRVAGSLFGHDKVYFVVGTNKLCSTLDDAIYRARNVAAPLNSQKYNLPTPCVKGNRCYDCNRPERICNAMVIYYKKMHDTIDMEIVLIDEEMGF